jgi:hypothetical protein
MTALKDRRSPPKATNIRDKFDSDQLGSPEVVQVQDAFEGAGRIDDDEGSDLLFFHQAEGMYGKLVWSYGAGMKVHGFAGGLLEAVGAIAFEQAAQVAVADDAEQSAVVLYGGHAEFFAGHLIDDVLHGRGGGDAGDGVASVHELADAGEALAQLAAGVEGGEILSAEAFFDGDGDGEGVSEGEHCGGGSGGGEAHSAGLGGDAAVERDVAGEGERGLCVAAEADEGVADALDIGEQAEDLLGFSTGGERDDDVAFGQHAEVAVDGFCRVQKERRAAGGAERGGDLLSDDATLAHPGYDDATTALSALQDGGHGAVKGGGHGALKAFGEGQKGFRLNAY